MGGHYPPQMGGQEESPGSCRPSPRGAHGGRHLLWVQPPAEGPTSEQPDPLKAPEKPVLCPVALKAQVLAKPGTVQP